MFLTTGDFENGLGSWRKFNYPLAVTATTVAGPAPKQGKSFMRVRTTQAGGSVAHDVVVAGYLVHLVGDGGGGGLLVRSVPVANSLNFSVWLRSAGGSGVRGSLAIWDLTDSSTPRTRNRLTPFNVGGQWTQVSVAWDDIGLNLVAFDDTERRDPIPTIRVEIYVDTINRDLDVDAAVLI